ncbi:MAG: NAD(P)H-dependent glycerol-3-phosphate dehydrogenase [Chitinophagales bacterium]
MSDKKYIGVIGAGSFGTAIANLIAENHDVLFYVRRADRLNAILEQGESLGQKLHERITPTGDVKRMTEECNLLFPTVPSRYTLDEIRKFAPYLRPDHILIHGTKGFNVLIEDFYDVDFYDFQATREDIQTISELIQHETSVVRIGCVSGPNLAVELANHQPAGSVIASHFEEVILMGRDALRSHRFQVYGTNDLIGVEFAGALKNIIAIASGAVYGLKGGENVKALLITKGLSELIRLGTVLGGDVTSFLGLAGIGDIIATASSTHSRNFTVGYRLAKGEKLNDIIETSEEVAEGINTVKICKALADNYKVRVPIIQALHQALFNGLPVNDALNFLMKYPFDRDVDFLD